MNISITELSREIGRDRCRDIECPECGAEIRHKCWGVRRENGSRKTREVNHMERYHAWARLYGSQLPDDVRARI